MMVVMNFMVWYGMVLHSTQIERYDMIKQDHVDIGS